MFSPHTSDSALQRLDAYIAGELGAEDRLLLEQMFERDPALRQHLHALVSRLATDQGMSQTTDARWDALCAELTSSSGHGVRPRRGAQLEWGADRASARVGARRKAAFIGAALAAVVVAAGTMTWTLTQRSPLQSSLAPSARHYTTRPGELRRITLADGTRLTLAPGSEARVQQRELWLTGEVFADVVPSSHAAFTVHTGTVTTQVLGTTFGVRRYDTDLETRVVVITGKVAVRKSGSSPLPVGAGTVAVVTDSSTTTTRIADPPTLDALHAWTDGRLVFRRTSAKELFSTVGRWYGYQFRVADSALMTQQITATFDNWPADEVLRELQELLGVTMTFDGNTITVRRAQSSAVPKTRPARRRHAIDGDTISMEVGR
jgi:transmembrane sensor